MLSLPNVGEHQQRSAMWKAARAGSVTGSVFADAIAFGKPDKAGKVKELARRKDLRLQLITERLTGIPAAFFSTKPMQRGTELEPEARAAYMMANPDCMVEEIGFIEHPAIEWCGVSLDGIVGDDGTIEMKCPNPETHLNTILLRSTALAKILTGEEIVPTASRVPEEHLPQIQGGLWVTGRKWCDFISYDNRFPKGMQLYVERVHRDEEYIAKLEAGLIKFLEEVEECVTQVLGVTHVEPVVAGVPDMFAVIAKAKAAAEATQ